MLTIQTAQARRNVLKVQLRPLGKGPLAHCVPVELDRIADDAAEFSDDQIEPDDALSIGLLRVAQRDL